MKNLITQKDLIEKNYEVFKYAGEYLFIGDAEIYIDRGDDDIIKFHDGGKYIRFVVSQKDLTFFFKGELDMLRIGDNTDFDIKIISERVSLKQDELLDILSQIRDNDIECCKRTNQNLEDIMGILYDIKDKIETEPDTPPVPIPAPVPVLVDLETGEKNVVVSDFSSSKKFHRKIVNIHEFAAYAKGQTKEYYFHDGVSSDGLDVVIANGGRLGGTSYGDYFLTHDSMSLKVSFRKLSDVNGVLSTSNTVIYTKKTVVPKPHVKVKIALKSDGTYAYDILNNADLVKRYGQDYKTEVRVNSSSFFSTLPSAVEGNNLIEVRVKGISETVSNSVIYVATPIVPYVFFKNLTTSEKRIQGYVYIPESLTGSVLFELSAKIFTSGIVAVVDIAGHTYRVAKDDLIKPIRVDSTGNIPFDFYFQGGHDNSTAQFSIVDENHYDVKDSVLNI